MARTIEIEGEGIRLGQLLKLADLVGSGAETKALISSGEVLVNGEVDQRRGRQLQRGDVVTVAGEQLDIA